MSRDLGAAPERLRQHTPALEHDRDFVTHREVAARVGVSYGGDPDSTEALRGVSGSGSVSARE
jgi:hypothetical protein